MLHILVLIVCWFAMMFGALQVQQVEMGHWFCGKWGCGPPANALIGMHLFWLVALAPPVWFAQRNQKLPWTNIGMALICTSVLALIGFAVYDVLGINKAYYEAGYVWQRYLLSVASLVDVPIVQTLLIGIGLVFFRRSPDADSNVSQDVTTKVVAAGGE